ncbi:MAG: hypothetical protein HOM58_23215 [Rhodospirillaceae bacterium]|jgi:hypothetical protein|nr:hypothetical protein [Rhodospirillaceae bacterium]MBT5457139.1 hypothetical protein [Rhodospirillaceae bacterium]
MKTPRKRRIAKSPEVRIAECETHLYFLWDARRLYLQQPERYKQIAAELRILVCETKSNGPLLLDLMDQYDFQHEVQPPGSDPSGPPLKPGPINLVGWRDDPDHKEISERLQKATKSENKDEMAEIDRRLAELAIPISFREWVNKGLALYIEPYDYSNRDLVLAISQQFGSSHEDETVEEPIVQMQQLQLLGQSSELLILVNFADYVISVGTAFISHMMEKHGFEPRYFVAEQVNHGAQ